jgi:hypothetical protein
VKVSDGAFLPVRADGTICSNYRTGSKVYASQKIATKKAGAGGSVYSIKLGPEGMVLSLASGPGLKLPEDPSAPPPRTVIKLCDPIFDPPPSKAKWVCTGEWGHVGPCTRRLDLDYWGNIPK